MTAAESDEDVDEKIQQINRKNVADSTRGTYTRYQRKLCQWMAEKYPEVFVNDAIDVNQL